MQPDLHLLVDGKRVTPDYRNEPGYLFRLAVRPAEIRIASRASCPQELGLARDSRSLGIAVRKITLAHRTDVQMIDADDRRLSEGFHAFEPNDNIRWIDGDARLPEGLLAVFAAPIELTIHLGCTTQYPDYGLPLPGHAWLKPARPRADTAI